MATVALKCPICHKLFTFTQKGDISRIKYCSRKCMEIANGYKKKGTYEKECKVCGKKFKTIYPKQEYCSSDCQKSVGHKQYVDKKGLVKKTCKYCLKSFKTTSKTKQYCSTDCYKENKRIRDNKYYEKHKEELTDAQI